MEFGDAGVPPLPPPADLAPILLLSRNRLEVDRKLVCLKLAVLSSLELSQFGSVYLQEYKGVRGRCLITT